MGTEMTMTAVAAAFLRDQIKQGAKLHAVEVIGCTSKTHSILDVEAAKDLARQEAHNYAERFDLDMPVVEIIDANTLRESSYTSFKAPASPKEMGVIEEIPEIPLQQFYVKSGQKYFRAIFHSRLVWTYETRLAETFSAEQCVILQAELDALYQTKTILEPKL